jgi:DNA polymerase-3 subunit delta'
MRFADIRGHERVCAFLRTASAQERLAHALLFAGPDGVGKRQVALALAAFLQCAQCAEDACGSCAPCRQIAAGSHPDVLVVGVPAGKKEIPVDRMRELKRFVQLQPVLAKAKVVIIDDAHMLTIAAQNALLKTLEEPPGRSFVILVANNLDALLPTVRSRCQAVRFGPLPTDTVVDILSTAHGIEVPLAREVAALAEGSPGRAMVLSHVLTAEARAGLGGELAALGNARYLAIMRLASLLNQPENATAVKLELLLSLYRDAAVRSVGAAHLAPAAADPVAAPVRTILRHAERVSEACETLRRSTPNRQLLLEALLLGIARS